MEALITAGAVSLAWSAVAVWLGPRIGFLDQPDDPSLKVHDRPAVPLGGVGLFLAIHVAALLRGELDLSLLGATTIVLVLGLVDDRRGLTPGLRLVVEVVAAVVLVFGVVGPDEGVAAGGLAVLLVVVAVNAVNLFDGLDGLAGSVGLVTALALAWLALERGENPWAALALAAALGGFLVLGWHPARVFLGDAGSYVLGVALAHAVLDLSPEEPAQLVLTSAILGVFIIDLIVTLARRLFSGRALFTGDRSHLYDQLRDRGLSVPGVALLAAGAQAAFTALVVVVDRSLAAWQGVAVLASVAAALILGLARLGFVHVDERRRPP